MIANSESEYAYNLPWHHDSACYNFRIPTETLSYEQIKEISDPENIKTLVIVVPLDNYDFIRDMVNLRYLYIYNDGELQDISFIEDLTKVGLPVATLVLSSAITGMLVRIVAAICFLLIILTSLIFRVYLL